MRLAVKTLGTNDAPIRALARKLHVELSCSTSELLAALRSACANHPVLDPAELDNEVARIEADARAALTASDDGTVELLIAVREACQDAVKERT